MKEYACPADCQNGLTPLRAGAGNPLEKQNSFSSQTARPIPQLSWLIAHVGRTAVIKHAEGVGSCVIGIVRKLLRAPCLLAPFKHTVQRSTGLCLFIKGLCEYIMHSINIADKNQSKRRAVDFVGFLSRLTAGKLFDLTFVILEIPKILDRRWVLGKSCIEKYFYMITWCVWWVSALND